MEQINITNYLYTAESKKGILILQAVQNENVIIKIDFNNNKIYFNDSEELPCSQSNIRKLFIMKGGNVIEKKNQETRDLLEIYNSVKGYYYEPAPYNIDFTLLLNIDKILHLSAIKNIPLSFITDSFIYYNDHNNFNFKFFLKIINFIKEKQYSFEALQLISFYSVAKEYLCDTILKEIVSPNVDKSPYANLINKIRLCEIIWYHFRNSDDDIYFGFSPKEKKEISNYLNLLIYWMAFEELPRWQNRIFNYENFLNLRDYFNACKILKIKPSKINPVKHILRTESLYFDYLNKEKNVKLLEKYNENFEKFFYENDEYTVIMPKSVEELIQEGEKLNNCIGHGGYDDKIIEGKSIILFVRRKENIDKPYVAMEISYNDIYYMINQYFTYNNENPKDDFAEDYYTHILEPLNNN